MRADDYANVLQVIQMVRMCGGWVRPKELLLVIRATPWYSWWTLPAYIPYLLIQSFIWQRRYNRLMKEPVECCKELRKCDSCRFNYLCNRDS